MFDCGGGIASMVTQACLRANKDAESTPSPEQFPKTRRRVFGD